MRTEEAAKRILTRTDPSARGGCAQRLLDSEREVGRLKAELAEAEAQLAVAKRQAADFKRQGSEAKKRLEAALADQRRLALQLGRSGGAGAGRSLACLSTDTLNAAAGGGGSPASGTKPPRPGAAVVGAGEAALVMDSAGQAQAETAAEAAAARRFAEQQEQLVAARERGSTLEQLLRQRDLLLEQQGQELASLRAQLAATTRCGNAAATSRVPGAGAVQAAATGLAPHQNLVELHLFAAELAADAPLGPLGLTFCTVDFWTCDTKISNLAEGCSPLFNTTLQFVVGMTAGLMEHLAAGCARVQLHACRSGAGGSGADYDTIASADIPLGCLISGEVRPAAYQQATLLRPDGSPCGTLQYALAALKPMRCHPAAGPLAAPSQAASPAKQQQLAAGQGQPHTPQRLLVDLVGCKDLRCSGMAASELQPYVALMLPQPGGRPGLVFEGRPAAGSSPAFGQQAAFSAKDAAAAGHLEAVVFNAAAGADMQESLIGMTRIAVPQAGSQAAGSGTKLLPLLHPTSGRHAGALEVGVRWG
ncbi:X-linked retinitis pigmentosa GTPase regulator-interacting 1 [Chlorella sorokiniana]|uniref:X-linked retinitis pigmentosa GTPase regulator-interacting 1 n=1 Tax=Chlorella sorokiniana TaxID=3076 RepID=A0A2P6U4F0_CHLSO|nr:X-linked retinitis pigmentosa GTPase regulator-interacting 1 [Chlorella sorokiniana]|eukprot:PRW61187.1 X-linked retinitis pigmentosa GTPase regulator-interacting 1 [Chlorella sorokiniana]